MSGASKSLKVDGKVLEGITQGPLPASRKVYVPGVLHPDVRVPMREISQTPTRHGHGPDAQVTPNPSIFVYDPSGNLVATSANGTSTGEAVSVPRPAAGTWRVQLKGFLNTPTNYTGTAQVDTLVPVTQ